jgi:hypothetical protein
MSELRLRDDLAWRETEEAVVALDSDLAHYLSTNAAGAMLWKALAHGTTKDALVEQLMAEFELDRDRAEHDVSAFVDQLAASELLAR